MGRRKFQKSGSFRKSLSGAEGILIHGLTKRINLSDGNVGNQGVCSAALVPVADLASGSGGGPAADLAANAEQSLAIVQIEGPGAPKKAKGAGIDYYMKLFGGKAVEETKHEAVLEKNDADLFAKYATMFGGETTTEQEGDGSYDGEGLLKKMPMMIGLPGPELLDDNPRRRKKKVLEVFLQKWGMDFKNWIEPLKE